MATWNVNSVLQRLDRLLAFLSREQPDFLCLQELKGADEKFPLEAVKAAGYRADVRCGGAMEVVAAICDPDQAQRYLRHVGEDYDPPPRAPPRSFQPQWEEFIEVAETPDGGGLE